MRFVYEEVVIHSDDWECLGRLVREDDVVVYSHEEAERDLTSAELLAVGEYMAVMEKEYK